MTPEQAVNIAKYFDWQRAKHRIGPSEVDFEWRRALRHTGDCCAWCGKKSWTLQSDHVIPISWLDFVTDAAVLTAGWERQPLCRKCNVRKGDKMVMALIPSSAADAIGHEDV